MSKNRKHVEAGRIGARARWGERRHVRINELEPNTAAVVRALVDADEAAKAAYAEKAAQS